MNSVYLEGVLPLPYLSRFERDRGQVVDLSNRGIGAVQNRFYSMLYSVSPNLLSTVPLLSLDVYLALLHDVAASSNSNFMDTYNLAIVFTPNLVSNENPSNAM